MVFRATSRRTDKGEFLAGSQSLGVIDMNFDSGQTTFLAVQNILCRIVEPSLPDERGESQEQV